MQNVLGERMTATDTPVRRATTTLARVLDVSACTMAGAAAAADAAFRDFASTLERIERERLAKARRPMVDTATFLETTKRRHRSRSLYTSVRELPRRS